MTAIIAKVLNSLERGLRRDNFIVKLGLILKK